MNAPFKMLNVLLQFSVPLSVGGYAGHGHLGRVGSNTIPLSSDHAHKFRGSEEKSQSS